MKIVETWRLFFQFYFLQVRVQEVQLGRQHNMKKKIPLLLASTLTVSMLGACSYQKEDNKAGAKEKSSNKQVLNLTETTEIPTMDTTLSTDATSSNIMNNTMEGLYRLGKMINLFQVSLNLMRNQRMAKSMCLSYVKMRNGLMVNL